ncbi:MAG: 50S ribosomal protein L10 [Bacteroidales bacterium]|nr:50S ribosomal protein L10 [Bacteroidales bacterium]
MRKEEKTQIIESLAAQLTNTPNFYLTDISGLNAENTAKLRRACFEKQIKLVVVKNTLLRKALEQNGLNEAQLLFPILEGPSAVMFTENVNAPAKLIKEFGKQYGKPVLKGALVQECAYVGENQLDALISIKSREELIGDIIGLLQSPAKNVISALQSNAGGKVAGIVKTLSEKE